MSFFFLGTSESHMHWDVSNWREHRQKFLVRNWQQKGLQDYLKTTYLTFY